MKQQDNISPNDLKWAPANVVRAAEHLIRMKKNKEPWLVIDEIFKVWKSTNPQEYEDFIYSVRTKKATSKVTKGFTGVSKDEDGRNLRHLAEIPVKVAQMIRKMYTPTELPMDKAFYQKFKKRYIITKVSEKL